MLFSLLNGELNGSLAGAAEAVTKAASSASGNAAPARSGGLGPMFWVFYIVCLVALFYFFAIRPNKKREQERQTLRE